MKGLGRSVAFVAALTAGAAAAGEKPKDDVLCAHVREAITALGDSNCERGLQLGAEPIRLASQEAGACSEVRIPTPDKCNSLLVASSVVGAHVRDNAGACASVRADASELLEYAASAYGCTDTVSTEQASSQ